MRERVAAAAVAGLVLAVKWGVVAFVVGTLVLLAAGDYRAVRVGSQQGAAAYAYLQRIAADAKAKPQAPKP